MSGDLFMSLSSSQKRGTSGSSFDDRKVQRCSLCDHSRDSFQIGSEKPM